MAFLDIVARAPQGIEKAQDAPQDVANLLDALNRGEQTKLLPAGVAGALLALIADAGDDIEKVKTNVGEWFDGSMDRVAAAERRASEPLTPATAADGGTSTPPPAQAVVGGIKSDVDAVVSQLGTLGLPIGWRYYDSARDDGPLRQAATARTHLIEQRVWPRWSGANGGSWVEAWWNQFASHLLGWLLTALAISFGAPFWFDLLNKIMVIRSTVKPREKSREEGSEDRQAPAGQAQTVRVEVAPAK